MPPERMRTCVRVMVVCILYPRFELLAALARVFRPRRIRWYVFGAQAAIVYRSARMTMDVDVTLAAPATNSFASASAT